MAVFSIETPNTLFTGTSGNDSIYNTANHVTMSGGAGNDTLFNMKGNSISINAGEGNDQVHSYEGDSIVVVLGSGDDYFNAYQSKNVTVYGGDGNDKVHSSSSSKNFLIDGGKGADTIYASGTGHSVNGGVGNDTLVGVGGAESLSIEGGVGNDWIRNFADNSILLGGAGNDSIANYDKCYSNDGVLTYEGVGKNVTIEGGKGNDTITNSSENVLFKYSTGDGNDIINGFNETSTLSIGGSYSTTKSNSNVIVTVVGEGKITLVGAASLSTINITGGIEYIVPVISGITISGNSTSLSSSLSGIPINILGSNDTLENFGGNVTITGSKGKDYICNNGSKALINTGAGDDSIRLNSYANDNVIIYKSGDGNDIIRGFNEDDTLSIGGGEYSATKNGDDIIVTVDDGKITIVDAVSLGSSLNIAGTKKVTTPATLLTVKDSTKSPVTVGSAVKVINAFSRTKAVKITGNKLANSIVGGSGNDTLNGGAGNDTLTGGKGKDIFVYSAGNDLITDYTAEDKISITSDTAEVSTSGNNVIFTVGNDKITVKGGKDKTITYSDAGGKNKKYKYEETPADDEIVILPKTYSKESYTMGNGVFTLDASAVRLDLNIVGNKFANSIIGSDQNDTLAGGKANDTLTGNGGSDIFVYKSGDGNDLITDYTEEDIIRIASGTISTVKTVGKDVIFSVGNGKISLKGAADKIVSYIDAGGEHTYGDTISAVDVKGKTVTLTENYTANSFDLTGYAKTMKTINATAVTRDLTITANDNANSILGGKGNDTLIGGKGNDTLNGRGGADIFLWNSGDGNDLILNYAEEDKIKITSGTVKASTSGKNVILSVGSNKITVKGAADKIVTYINKNGIEIGYSNTVAVKGKVATLSDKYSRSTFVAGDYSSAIRTINASKVSKNLSITGSAFADSIAGGAGNDTLIGGHGNDTFKGGNGSDIFLYKKGDGNDTITDYSPGDKIKIASGTVADKVEVNGKDVTFTVNNSGTITVKNGKGKKITLIDKNGNESGKIYNSSKLWFTADDNNFDTDARLSSIVKSSAAYSFDTSTDLTSLTQKNNFITYADKK